MRSDLQSPLDDGQVVSLRESQPEIHDVSLNFVQIYDNLDTLPDRYVILAGISSDELFVNQRLYDSKMEEFGWIS